MIAAQPTAAIHETTACFLCALDTTACQTANVEGTINGAQIIERGGRTIPQIGVRTLDGEDVLIELSSAHVKLVERLKGIPPAILREVPLRVLHLGPAKTVRPASGKAAYQRYRALPATLCILAPDLLLNITDLSNGNYCVRQELLRHLYPGGPSPASVRGNLIHNIFKEMLKRSAGRQLSHQDETEAIAADLAELLDEGLRSSVVQIAQAGATEQEIREDAAPHLDSLRGWLARQRSRLFSSQPSVRAETFLLAPEIGLKGRLDILWEDAHERRLLELKTGRVGDNLPKSDHRWQVFGYHALLSARRNEAVHSPPMATLLYSGTPGQASGFAIPCTLREIQQVLAVRNELALVRLTGRVPSPPGGNKCLKCFQRASCAEMSPMLGWEAPPVETLRLVAKEDAAWFRHWHELQRLEAREADKETHALWQQTPAERIGAGSAIGDLILLDAQETEKHEWIYHFRCENISELREGDEVLLSVDDPVRPRRNEVVSGSILTISSTEVTVWAREEIPDANLIDRYSADVTNSRMLGNLTRWLHVDDHLRSLVRGAAKPRFDPDPPPITPALLAGLNGEQATAVVRALTMKDYLLIQGPPGTGKTKVIAAITHALLARGYRVALAAFTNQATDNMLARLVESGVTRVVRLGHELATAPAMRDYRLIGQARAQACAEHPTAEQVRDTLRKTPVVAATVATWSSDEHEIDRTMPAFDVVIVDEATQLTVPATLGALRWGKRFILVGDEKQLPPLVQSENARVNGLGTSLFESLLVTAPEDACVRLRSQYRMHAAINAFPSRAFYGDKLKPAPAVAQKTLNIIPTRHERILDPAQPLVWVEIMPNSTALTKLNDAEAQIAADLAQSFVASGVAPADLGIIAPFRAQAAHIRQMITNLVKSGTTVDTVDRFQGGERSVIILSLVATTAPAPDSQLGKFLCDARRLNVALTRARHKLVILGHRPAFASLPLLRDLALHCDETGAVIHWDGHTE